MRTGRPLVTLKTAITLDGKISAPDDNRGWITSERARAHVQELRHDHDAILTGIGTVLADDCLLTDRTGLARCRPLLRVDHGFATPPAARFENGAQRRRRCGGGGHFGLFRRAAQAARRPRHPRADLRWPRRAGRSAQPHRLAGPATLSFAHDRGRQQGQLDGARERAWSTASFSITDPRSWAVWKRSRWPAASGGAGARTPFAFAA